MWDQVFHISLVVVAFGVIVALIAEYVIPGGSQAILVSGGVIAGLGGLASAVSGILTILPING